MANLITATQVISEAFNASVQTGQIKDRVIEAAEFEYIRPALTENFYQYVVQNTATVDVIDADITESDGRVVTGLQLITDLIIPAEAFYVKYMALNDILFEVSERGGFELLANNTVRMSNQARQDYAESTLKTATQLLEKMVDYIKKQKNNNTAKYDLYRDFTGVSPEKQIIGGLLINDTTYISKEDEN